MTSHEQDNGTNNIDNEETPFYGDEKKTAIIKRKNPLPPPAPGDVKSQQLKDFLKKVVILLVTINENEIWSALNYMKPPLLPDGNLSFQVVNQSTTMIQNSMLC